MLTLLALAACTAGSLPDGVPPGSGLSPPLSTGDTGTAAAPRIEPLEPCPDYAVGAGFERTVLAVEAPNDDGLRAGGFVAVNLTGDGLVEVFSPGLEGSLWSLGADGAWTDRSEAWLPDLTMCNGVGGSAADIDADGNLDLVVTCDATPDRLLRNDGDRLTDITDAAGLATGEVRTMSASWADVDADGDLNLYLGGYGPQQPSSLWLGDGAGGFTDGSAQLLPQAVDGYAFGSAFADLEGDGRPDLFVANDYPQTLDPALLANRADGWTHDVDSGYHGGFSGMGITLANLNDDGLPDLLETSFRLISYMASMADPDAEQGVVYVRSSAAGGLGQAGGSRVFGWGIDAADLDLDGDLELEVAFGFWDHDANFNEEGQPDSLYTWRHDEQRFDRLVDDHDPEPVRGVLFVDLEGDGRPDRIKRTLDGELWIDHLQCGEGAWLTVSLDDPSSANRHGVGATVRVLTDPVQTRWIEAGSRSMFVGGPPLAHVGLGHLEAVDVEVIWPDLGVTRVQQVATRQHLVISR